MEIISDFQLSESARCSHSNVFIGKINQLDAIYIIQSKNLDMEKLEEQLLLSSSKDASKIRIPFLVTTRLIYPATESHIKKYVQKYKYCTESFNEYLGSADFLKISWLHNIIINRDVKEKVYIETDDYVVIADYKWNQKLMDQLYLLLIFKADSLKSIRNLDGNHLPLLRDVKKTAYELGETFGLSRDQICLFFHYRPSYFKLHLHIVNIKASLCNVGSLSRVILLDDVIMNLEMDSKYFERDFNFISVSC